MLENETATILIADAQHEEPGSPKSILSSRYRVEGIESAEAILRLAKKSPSPLVIFLDITIRNFDSYAICHQLKSEEPSCTIPIILFSRYYMITSEARAMECGADDFIYLPVQPFLLLQRVHDFNVLRNTDSKGLSCAMGSSHKLEGLARSLIDYGLDALIITDLQDRIIVFNQSAEELFGFSRDEVIGKDIAKLIIPPEFRFAHQKGIKALREQPNLTPRFLRRIFLQGLHSNGARIDLELSLFLTLINGVIHCVASIRDITAYKQLSLALKDTLLVAENSFKDKMIEIDRVRSSERNATISLQTQKTVNHLLHLSLETRSLQEQLQRALGFIVRLPWLASENIHVAIFLWDRVTNGFNLVAQEPDNCFPQQHQCTNVSDECSSCIVSMFSDPMMSVYSLGSDMTIQEKMEGKIDYCIPLFSGNENLGILRLVVSSSIMKEIFDNLMFNSIGQALANIIVRSRIDQELQDAREKAEAVSKAKSEFLANMSHEIRSPLNAIIGMTDLVLSAQLSKDEIFSNLQIVRSSSLSLLDLINGILDLSKIEAGHFALEYVPFDLVGQLENACDMLAIKAHQKGLGFYCQIAPDLPALLDGDPLRLKQIVVNLINNAIKFTHEGEIVLSVQREAPLEKAPEDAIHVRFSVSDTGIGIPDEQLHLIFQSFVQADGSISRKYGGTGLGLTISKHLVYLMGGSLQVESQVGHGSMFYFTIRLGLSRQDPVADSWMKQGPEAYQSHPTPLQDRRILLVDNHPTGRAILHSLLLHFGASVEMVSHAPAMMDCMRTHSDNPFDVIMVDEEIVQEAEAGLIDEAHYPAYSNKIILMISSHLSLRNFILEGLFKNAISLKKPIRNQHLLKKILHIISPVLNEPNHKYEENEPLRKRTDIQPLEILLVEDLPENQKLAMNILHTQDHKVTVASNGVEALLILTKGARFDLILMDLQMPEMDGFETTRRIRSGSRQEVGDPQVPIVAVTAMVMMNEKKRCLEVGMNGFLLKPYLPIELINIVASFSKKRKTGQPPVNREIVLNPVETDPTNLIILKQSFIKEAFEHLEKLKKSLMQENSGTVIREGTWLKSMAAQIGASRIVTQTIRMIGQVETEAWEDALMMCRNLEQYVESLIHFLIEEDQKHENFNR
ncbi:MAG: response regulator [Magnetococcales bacterium]|nr:response regulator [Magnetococcales bacterium]